MAGNWNHVTRILLLVGYCETYPVTIETHGTISGDSSYEYLISDPIATKSTNSCLPVK